MNEFIKDYLRNFSFYLWLTLLLVFAAWLIDVGPFLLIFHVCLAISMGTSVIVTLVERADFECEDLIQNVILTLWSIIEFAVILNLFE